MSISSLIRVRQEVEIYLNFYCANPTVNHLQSNQKVTFRHCVHAEVPYTLIFAVMLSVREGGVNIQCTRLILTTESKEGKKDWCVPISALTAALGAAQTTNSGPQSVYTS